MALRAQGRHAVLNALRAAALALGLTAGGMARAQADVFLPPLAAPAPATPYRFTAESELARWPGWQDIEAATREDAELTRGAFEGAAGARIHYRLYQHREERRGAIVIASGRTEGLALYQELVHDLVRNGYSVYLHDHRGQGFSQRLLQADDSIGYVDEFERYVDDLAGFIGGPVRAARAGRSGPLFLLAHSMGGAIAALYLERVPQDGVAAAALVTPMMEPWVASGPDAGPLMQMTGTYCEQHPRRHDGWIGRLLSARYAQGTGFDDAYAELRRTWPGADNDLTHSAVRFARHWEARDQARCAGADCGSPHAKVGGVSFRWLNQACIASREARGPAAGRINVPVLLLQGEADTVVKPGAQKQFCEHLNAAGGAGYCVGRQVPQGRHALFIEADAYRVPALTRVLGFFDCVRGGTGRCD